MQQHFGIFIVSSLLVLAFVLFFVIKFTSKRTENNDVEKNENDTENVDNLNTLYDDEIIAVRKIDSNEQGSSEVDYQVAQASSKSGVYVLHVMAKPSLPFKGYELLQALLSQGLRFGEMSIFHRHQQTNGKGPVLFSLTSAVEPGTFDIHNMGTFSCPGLTLFMASSGRSNVDIERFNLMVKTANNIARELNGLCQDKYRNILTDQLIDKYKHQIFDGGIKEVPQTESA